MGHGIYRTGKRDRKKLVPGPWTEGFWRDFDDWDDPLPAELELVERVRTRGCVELHPNAWGVHDGDKVLSDYAPSGHGDLAQRRDPPVIQTDWIDRIRPGSPRLKPLPRIEYHISGHGTV